MIRLIDSLSYSNRLRGISPMWKCGFAAALFMLSYGSHPPVQAAIFAWMIVWVVRYARIPLKAHMAMLGTACLFFIASLPALLVEIQPGSAAAPGSSVFVLWSRPYGSVYVTETGLRTAAALFMRAAACLSAVSFVMFTTPVAELFQVMKRLRVPALALELMLITYRFLFILTETAHDLYTAQMARGGHNGFRGRLNDTALLIVRLFVKTMHRYKGLSHGLVSRGFTEEIRPAPYRAGTVPARYRLESGIGVAILLLLECWLRWRGIV